MLKEQLQEKLRQRLRSQFTSPLSEDGLVTLLTKFLLEFDREWLEQKRQEHKKLETLTRSPKISEMHYWKAEEDNELLEELEQ
jgi:hypothetical protein